MVSHGEPGPLHHPGVVLPGKDAVPGAEAEGRLYIQGQKYEQELPGHGVAGKSVFPHPQQRRADGAVVKIM